MCNAKFALLYIRNGQEMVFLVEDIDQAVQIADAIANSDLLNDAVDYNLFDVYEYRNGRIRAAWETDEGLTFEEYWEERRNNRQSV